MCARDMYRYVFCVIPQLISQKRKGNCAIMSYSLYLTASERAPLSLLLNQSETGRDSVPAILASRAPLGHSILDLPTCRTEYTKAL